jgi:hypothetical protein
LATRKLKGLNRMIWDEVLTYDVSYYQKTGADNDPSTVVVPIYVHSKLG